MTNGEKFREVFGVLPDEVGLTYVIYDGQIVRHANFGDGIEHEFTYPVEKWAREEYSEPISIEEMIGIA